MSLTGTNTARWVMLFCTRYKQRPVGSQDIPDI